MTILQRFWTLIKATGQRFGEIDANRQAAALAYYTIFSLAPLLVVAVAIASQILSEDAIRDQIEIQITRVIGSETAANIQTMIANTAGEETSGILTTIISVVTLWWAASNLFNHIQLTLNKIWGVQPRAQAGVLGFIKARLLAVLMVIGVSVLMVISILMLTILSAVGDILRIIAPGFVRLAPLIDLGFTLTVLFLGSLAVFKVLPNINGIDWKDVAIGAFFTALLLSVAKYLISWYLGTAGVASAYGAAGSLVLLLLWAYYSSMIFLFGATFTRTYAMEVGSKKRGPLPPVPVGVQDSFWPSLPPDWQPSMQRQAAPQPSSGDMSLTLWGTVVAFIAGLIVGARRGHD